MLGGIEAGGTKFVCAVADEDFNIIDRVSFPTTIPSETCSTQDHLLHSIRSQFEKLLSGYVSTPDLTSYIVSPGLKGDAGIVGALLLAEKVKQRK